MSNVENLQERNLILNGDIKEELIGDLIKKIININIYDDSQEKELANFTREPIKLYINTNGGLVYDGFGLIGIMKNSKTSIHTIVLGKAFSCGVPILLAGHKKYAYEYSSIMIHQISGGARGKLIELQNNIDEGNRIEKIYENMILNNTKITQKQINDMNSHKKDWFLSAEEALELGIIDEIII